MDQHQRTRDRAPMGAGAPEGGEPASGPTASRRIEDLLGIGDRIIRETLSRDSQSFLRQMRQQGGE